MSVYALSIALTLLALVALFATVKALLKSGWFLKWLQGSAGMIALVFTIAASLLALDLFGYLNAKEGQPLAVLAFSEVGNQEFDVELTQGESSKSLYRLLGDQWQLDVRLINSPLFALDGLPSYKLDRISGRYLSLEQEQESKRSVHGLAPSGVVDFWEYLPVLNSLGVLKSQHGSAAFMPMVDGAIYQVVLYEKGIKAEPVNEIANRALVDWN